MKTAGFSSFLLLGFCFRPYILLFLLLFASLDSDFKNETCVRERECVCFSTFHATLFLAEEREKQDAEEKKTIIAHLNLERYNKQHMAKGNNNGTSDQQTAF